MALARRDCVRGLNHASGYGFITSFILLSAAAAFWPAGFFHDNLATLEQLNRRFLSLLAVFIPALTMGVWADERRYGTDDLLRSLPMQDWQIVIGKYLAILAIYTCALLLSV